jgi:hypothetical protein
VFSHDVFFVGTFSLDDGHRSAKQIMLAEDAEFTQDSRCARFFHAG